MNRTFVIFLLMLVASWFPALRAQGTLEGVVTSREGVAIEFANVGVVSSSIPYGVSTDRKGHYRLDVKERDSVTVRVSCTGYVQQEFRIRLKEGENRKLNMVLAPSTTELKTVSITDDRIRSSTFTEINIQRIENRVGPNDGVEALLKTLPDVNSNNELSSQYSVRGGSFDENLVYINGVEIFRPQLIRSGQQEGLSIINPDMVDHIFFSPGGFDVTYGDRMSSVLDIIYNRPVERRHRLSLSFLGGSASAQGRLGNRFTYSVGLRYHNNRYLFQSLNTEGDYTTSYTDLQGVFSYRFNDSLDLSLLTLWTRNVYGFVPYSSTVTFGTFDEPLMLHLYFDGMEKDRYGTLLGSLNLSYHPDDDLQLNWITSLQQNTEQELYDIQSQYHLYELGMGENIGDTNQFDRGVGTFLEHARNYLDMTTYSTEVKAVRYALLGCWRFGIGGQLDQVKDRMREWKWVDSAGYSYPTDHHIPGVDDTVVYNPVLQLYCNANNQLQTLRGTAYAQREVSLFTRHDDMVKLIAGLRGQYYAMTAGTQLLAAQFLLSPRLSVNYKPHGNTDIQYRLTAGIYQQPNRYREIRLNSGALQPNVPAQCSYQATGSVDWNLRLWDMPFRFTADIYYKYITHLVPYTIDNMRVRYNPEQEAVGYAVGTSLRINGDFVPGLESWASISLLKTQEDIIGDNLGWLARPTDQRFSFKIFLQDYMPTIPWWRMSLSLFYGTTTPTTFPYQRDRSVEHRLPAYFRVDWGNTVQLTRFERIRNSRWGKLFDDISVGIEVFNLFNYRNVVSYLWVADYTNYYHAVPNYLTARQVNLKLNLTF